MNYADPVTLYIITEETDKERVKPLFRLLLAMILPQARVRNDV